MSVLTVREIKLARNSANDKYKVLTVKNSVAYNPGDVLSRDEVNDLCEHTNWEVTVVSLNPKMEK